MKKLIPVLGLALVAVAGTATIAQGRSQSAKAGADICVLLPDTKSSVRWETADRPFLDKAFTAAGISHTIVNAEGDAQKQKTQADSCLSNGAKVLVYASLDAGSAKAIDAAAKAKGAKVVDYDRLNVGGSAAVYVSFDNVAVGKLMGQGVVADLKARGKLGSKPVIAYLNGGPTDNNATLFKQGYAGVIDPLFKSGQAIKGPDQAVPGWDNQKARTIFEGMLAKTSNKIDAVAAANDGLANAVVTALKAKKLKSIPVSGQDATAQGIQNVLAGWQSGSVYKAVRAEANAAAKAAIALAKGGKPVTTAKVSGTPSILLVPKWITKKNYTFLFTDGYLKKSDVCNGAYKKYCK